MFESSIPFQLAFYALIEHDSDVAPFWDPVKRKFIGLMTVFDYIQALRIWHGNGLPVADLATRTIERMKDAPSLHFCNKGFKAVTAEDSVLDMCNLMLKTGNDYIPVLDPENGNLVSIMNMLDVAYLVDQAAKHHPQLFLQSVQQAGIGTFTDVLFAPRKAKIAEVLAALHTRNLSALPIIDDTGVVVNVYHRSDVSFIMRAAGPDAIVENLLNYTVEDAILMRDQLLQTGEIMSASQGLVTCLLGDLVSAVCRSMLMARTCRAIIVDEAKRCIGVVTLKDIIRMYTNFSGARR